jgi:two-component system cell cycle response regulator
VAAVSAAVRIERRMNDGTDDVRILVVEESDGERLRLRRALSGMACLRMVQDATSALAIMDSESVDLVVCPFELFDRSGTQLLEQLGREYSGTDCIALVEEVRGEIVDEALRAGAVSVLPRAPEAEHLYRAVEQVLQRRRLQLDNRGLRDRIHSLDASRTLLTCLDPGKVYPLALDILLETLSRRRGIALFHRASIQRGDALAFRGFSEGEEERLRNLLTGTKPVDFSQMTGVERTEKGPLQALLREADIDSRPVLSAPIRGRDAEAGVVWVLEDGRPFSDEERDLALLVVEHAALAIENSERYEHAKERAFIDDVTEVYNARYLLSAAENEIQRNARYDSSLSVLFLDLDRFKLVNDRYGHLVGSNTLRHLSQVLLQCIRQVDTLARYGGDEFTVLLVDTEHSEALVIAERIRRTVEEHVFEVAGEASLRLTISIGVATCPDHGTSRDLLLDASDKAMYRSKSLGRNRVCSVDEL